MTLSQRLSFEGQSHCKYIRASGRISALVDTGHFMPDLYKTVDPKVVLPLNQPQSPSAKTHLML